MNTSSAKAKLIVVAGAIALFIGIWLLPRKADSVETPASAAASTQFSVEEKVKDITKRLPDGKAQQMNTLVASLEGQDKAHKFEITDSVAKTFDRYSQFLAGGYYYEKLALEFNEEKPWLNAAYRYFDAYRSSSDSINKASLLQKTISAYNHVIELNPENLDAKTDLGVCYTETPQPMKGITLLREVITKNPRHENALMDLGMLSMRSKQFEKGIDRFKQVIDVNKERSDAYLYLGECYAQTGKNAEAIKNLSIYRKMISDKARITEVEQLINKLKQGS